jgi:hypothetical protein
VIVSMRSDGASRASPVLSDRAVAASFEDLVVVSIGSTLKRRGSAEDMLDESDAVAKLLGWVELKVHSMQGDGST